MLVVASALAGAALGWLNGWRRGAKPLDRLHQAGVGAIICGAASIVVVIIIARMN